MELARTDRPPVHPGQALLKEFLEPMELTQRELAQAIHVPYQRVNDVVRQRRGVTPSTALRLAKFLGTTADFWMGLQLRWDLYHAQSAEQEELERIEPRAPAVAEHVLYSREDDALASEIREGMAARTIDAQIQMPQEVFAVLEQRSAARGATPAQQIVEMVIAYLQGEVDPILQPDDPILSIPAAEGTGPGDLSTDHDRYLYRQDWQERLEGNTSG
jgi:addiction module HigA family antidote